MNYKQFKVIRLIIIGLVTFTVATAVSINNFFLALAGVLIGMLFMHLVRVRYKKVMVDERVAIIGGRAARHAYVVSVTLLTLLCMFFIISGDRRGDIYTEALGVALGFIVLLNVALYSVSFYYFNRKYGGDEK
ncbi:DUF2178 domain-containing protein [Patescibacteria group bacterium]|nr:DUF2178 domain-containing protein [Patescibacteria group bacterium]MBU1922431.1 DUF2178 domain-containing protein [Patescibacteria group bacterium]